MPTKHTSKCEDQEKRKKWGANEYYIIISLLQQAEPTNIVYHAQKKENTWEGNARRFFCTNSLIKISWVFMGESKIMGESKMISLTAY